MTAALDNPLGSAPVSAIEIVIRPVNGGFGIFITHPQAADRCLAAGYASADAAAAVIAEALTAPLATEERLAGYDEGMGRVQGLIDEVAALSEKLDTALTRVAFLQELIAAAIGGSGRSNIPVIGAGELLQPAAAARRDAPRTAEQPGGLRRALAPHQSMGGVVRGPAAAQVPMGDPDVDG